MATAAPTDNRVYLYRLLTLNIDCGTTIVRNLIDDKCRNTALTALLAQERRTVINLRANKTITKVQIDLLYPQSGTPPTTADFDLSLATCLLRSLKQFGLNSKFTWNATPQPGDTSLEADLCRLRMYRNELAHISSTTGIQETDFSAKWADIEGALHRLNGLVQNPVQGLQQIINDYKTGPLDPEAEKEIEKQIEKMQKMEERLEIEVQDIKKGVADVTKDIHEMKDEVIEVKGGVHTVLKDVHKLKEDFKSTHKRMDELEKQRASEETKKGVGEKTPNVFERIYGWFTFSNHQKKEETESSMPLYAHPAAEDVYLQMKKNLQRDLIVLYRQRYHTLPLSPLLEESDTPLLKFYVMPDVVSVEIQRSLGGGREDRLKVTSLHDVFYKESKPCREIYLTADAGLGKTAFSKRLILTWCQAKQFINNEEKYFKSEAISTMSEFEFVFLLSLRDYSDECDIDDMIIKQIIPRLASTSVTISDLETILSKEKCLLILDGLDEWTHPVSVCKQGRSDIPHRKARKCTILTTTRPWKMSVIKLSSCQIEQKLELVGLNETSVQSLKRSVITLLCGKSDIEKHIQDFDRAVHDKSISDLEAIPLLLTYLLCLWCDDIDLGRSKSELYCQIIELLMKRTFEKYPDMQQARESSRSDIPQCVSGHVHCEKLYKLLKALGQLSFETLFSENKENTLVFKLSVAEKYLNPDYLKLSLLSGILTQSKVQEKITIQSPKVSFSHKTMQEYLCALYISCHSDSDIQKIVLQNCRSLQNILDMSTVFVFISGMNSKIISSISYELMSVISQDEITVEYRSTTSYDMFMRHPLKDIQDMYISCIKENPDNEDLRLSCQDVFFGYDFEQEKYFTRLKRLAIHNKNNMESINIDTLGGPSLHKIVDSCALVEPFNINKLYYYGRGEETVLIKLLNRSGQCVTVISSVQFGSWTSEMSKTLQNNALLQAVYIRLFKMSHDVLNGFLNYIVNRKTMTEIRIENLMCTEHRRSCTLSLDFRQHSDLRKLELHYTPKVSQLKVNSQVKYVALWDINLTEMLLPPEMVNIERVELWFVNMSASSFRDLVKVVEKLSHKVTVKIKRCEMRPETEAENVKQFIRSSQNFRVTEDVGSQFVFETI